MLRRIKPETRLAGRGGGPPFPGAGNQNVPLRSNDRTLFIALCTLTDTAAKSRRMAATEGYPCYAKVEFGYKLSTS